MGPLIIMFTRVLRVDGIASLWRFVGNLSFKGFLKLQNIYSQLARWYALGIKDVSPLREGAFRSGRADNYLSFKYEVQTWQVLLLVLPVWLSGVLQGQNTVKPW